MQIRIQIHKNINCYRRLSYRWSVEHQTWRKKPTQGKMVCSRYTTKARVSEPRCWHQPRNHRAQTDRQATATMSKRSPAPQRPTKQESISRTQCSFHSHRNELFSTRMNARLNKPRLHTCRRLRSSSSHCFAVAVPDRPSFNADIANWARLDSVAGDCAPASWTMCSVDCHSSPSLTNCARQKVCPPTPPPCAYARKRPRVTLRSHRHPPQQWCPTKIIPTTQQ